MTWLSTVKGTKVDLLDPRPEQFDIEEIAMGLARLPRFVGQTAEAYSVAQHSVLVAFKSPHELRLQGLLHDAAEAYTGDIPRPVKDLCPDVRVVEHRLWTVIAEKFGVPVNLHPHVKHADDVLLLTEKRDLQPDSPEYEGAWAAGVEPLDDLIIDPWTAEQAEAEFLAAFVRYAGLESRWEVAGDCSKTPPAD